jgi:hypothetical protein
MRHMRILLQRRDDGQYFRDIDSWVSDPAEAMDFVSSTAALDFCAVNQLGPVQVVLKFEGERYEIVLPDVASQPRPTDRPSASA